MEIIISRNRQMEMNCNIFDTIDLGNYADMDYSDIILKGADTWKNCCQHVTLLIDNNYYEGCYLGSTSNCGDDTLDQHWFIYESKTGRLMMAMAFGTTNPQTTWAAPVNAYMDSKLFRQAYWS